MYQSTVTTLWQLDILDTNFHSPVTVATSPVNQRNDHWAEGANAFHFASIHLCFAWFVVIFSASTSIVLHKLHASARFLRFLWCTSELNCFSGCFTRSHVICQLAHINWTTGSIWNVRCLQTTRRHRHDLVCYMFSGVARVPFNSQ